MESNLTGEFVCDYCLNQLSDDEGIVLRNFNQYVYMNEHIDICLRCEKKLKNREEFKRHWELAIRQIKGEGVI